MTPDTISIVDALVDLQDCVGGLLIALIAAVTWRG